MKKYIRADENLEDFEIKGDVLVKYHGNASHVRIPDGIREIGRSVFFENSTLKSIDLNDVKIVGFSAFSDCTNLTTVVGPKVEVIDMMGFSSCSRLQYVELPSVKTLGGFAFFLSDNLTEISMPDNVKIGSYAFECTPFEGMKARDIVKVPVGSKSNSHVIPDDQSPEESGIWDDIDEFWDDVEYEQSYVGKVLWAVMDRLKDAGYENPEFDSGGTQRHGEDFIRFTADGTRYEARLDFEDEVEIIWELGVNKSIGSFYDRIIDRAEPIDED